MLGGPGAVQGAHGKSGKGWWKPTTGRGFGHDGRMELSSSQARPVRVPLNDSLLSDLLVAPQGPLARLEVVAKIGSTNTELAKAVAHDSDAWPAPALLVADHQEAGRGRLDRAWQTPEHTALTGSLLLRPPVAQEHWTWLPLLMGLAAVRAIRAMTGVAAGLKWPNDVLVPTVDEVDMLGWGRFRKAGGILAEVQPDGSVIIGLGLNVLQTAEELPVASASSLWLAGASTLDRELLLTGLHEALSEVLERWYAAEGDAEAAGLREEIEEVLVTVGHEIRAYVPGGREVRGRAVGLTREGGLAVVLADGREEIVLSGDVHHVRLVDQA